MRNRLFISIVLISFFCVISSAIARVVSSGPVPVSSVRSGLVRSVSPIDRSSNLVVTGNVSGGKYFRGVLPYHSASDFVDSPGSLLHGSSSLDSFLRRSAGSSGFESYRGKLTPYYSRTGTVTAIRPGGGFTRTTRTPSAVTGGVAVYRAALPKLDKAGAVKSGRSLLNSGLRPMSMTSKELERKISSEFGKYQKGKMPVYEPALEQMEYIKGVSEETSELKQGLKEKASEDIQQWHEKQLQARQAEQEGSQIQESVFVPTGEKSDVFEQMKQQINELQERLDMLSASEQSKTTTAVKKQSGQKLSGVAGLKEQRDIFSISMEDSETADEASTKSFFSDEVTESDSSSAAENIPVLYKSFASFSKDKFNQHIRAGEEYLKQGRYYRAADAYTLASIYKPNDPLAYAGKSQALFAAGEYMSSALFLFKTLEIFPDYARFKIDIVAMVGDRDELESRIADVEKWLERTDAAELHFLLGYVYYQMGRLDRARSAIDAAYEKMPDSPGVAALKKSIDACIETQSGD